METRERRLCALSAPHTTHGATICWDFNSHFGCNKQPFTHCYSEGNQTFRNYDTLTTPLKIYLLNHGGFKGHKKPETGDIPKKIKELREKTIKEEKEKRAQKKTEEKNKSKPREITKRNNKKVETRTPKKKTQGATPDQTNTPVVVAPTEITNLDCILSEEKLRGSAIGADFSRAPQLPQEEDQFPRYAVDSDCD